MSSDRSPGEEGGSPIDERTSLTSGTTPADGSTTDDSANAGAVDDGKGEAVTDADLSALPIDPDRRRRLTGEESAVDAVLQEVSTMRECEPLDLPPLFEAVDTDLLDGVHARGSAGEATWLSFVYAGCLVTLTGRGFLTLRLIDDATERFVA